MGKLVTGLQYFFSIAERPTWKEKVVRNGFKVKYHLKLIDGKKKDKIVVA